MALALKQNALARTAASSPRRAVVCAAAKPEPEARERLGLASSVAATLIAGAAVPQEAIAAGSGGRAGGSRFSSARAGGMSRPGGYGAGYNTGPRVSNTTVVVGAPSYSPFGFGFGGFGFGMPVYRPFGFGFGFGFLFQLLFITAIVGFIASVIKNMMNGGNNNRRNRKDDGWGDL